MDNKAPAGSREAEQPPIYSSIEELSQGSAVNARRYKNLVDAFKTKYGVEPQLLGRAPGRVNIIGEHIDYSGYAVLPMAMEQDVVIACRPKEADPTVNIANMDPQYPDHQADKKLSVAEENKQWYDYVLCGVTGVRQYCKLKTLVGMDLLVDGNIPPASGLSSSSAVVCSAALVTALANKIKLPSKAFFGEMCGVSEHLIGTEGGGMDQAISFLGETGKALMIEFRPIRTTEVKLPEGCVFVIANTLISSKKASASSAFNIRVAESRLAALVMARQVNLNKWHDSRRLMHFQRDYGCELNEACEKLVETQLHSDPYSYEEMCDIFEKPKWYIRSEYLCSPSHGATHFQLHDRAKHVFEEAGRVRQFKEIANAQDGVDIAVKLGQLMDESHASCRDLYDCSSPELDEVVGIAKSAGSLGSRLTGAGWGGCTVSLVTEDKCQELMEKLRDEYFKKHQIGLDNLDDSLFVTKPGAGAALCLL